MVLPESYRMKFFMLIIPLQDWMKRKRAGKDALKKAKKRYGRLDMQTTAHALLDAVWEKPELIDQYLKEMGGSLSEETQSVLRDWREHVVPGPFIVERNLKSGTVFISAADAQVYMVSGITSEIEADLPSDSLPCVVETALVPFADRIIYDSTMAQMTDVPMREGKKKLNELYQSARRGGAVIRKLDGSYPEPDETRQGLLMDAVLPVVSATAGTPMDEFQKQLENNPEVNLIPPKDLKTLETMLNQKHRTDEDWDVIKGILLDRHVVTAGNMGPGGKMKELDEILYENGHLVVFTTTDKCMKYVKKHYTDKDKTRFSRMTILPFDAAMETADRHKTQLYIDPAEGPLLPFYAYDGETSKLSAAYSVPGKADFEQALERLTQMTARKRKKKT